MLVRLHEETVWLTQAQMAELFQTTKQNISLHIRNVFDEGELEAEATVKDYLTVQQEGERSVQRSLAHYNLDVVISVGYRVRSHVGTRFRIWATQRLREYLVKGFTLDDQRLKEQATPADYFDELLERIRDIRSSEKVLYARTREICALSLDYDGTSDASRRFFQTVQNKLHYAASGRTAAEIVVDRASAELPNMGLTSWSGDRVRKKDVVVAKNYLQSEEIQTLNLLVAQYLDFAELQARSQRPMRMANWLAKLDDILRLNERGVLAGPGSVSHSDAEQRAHAEYAGLLERRKSEASAFDSLLDAAKSLEADRGPAKRRKRSEKDP
ncbi:MAG: virulence RhuM family protein [Actinomycetota bacterium]